MSQQQHDPMLANLNAALDAAHGATTADKVRLQASQFLENFKTTTQPNIAVNISLTLICNDNIPIQSRHYGFQLLEHVLQTQYGTLQPHERQLIQQQIMHLVQPQSLTPLQQQSLSQQLPTLNLQAIQVPPSLINYKIHQSSILASKLANLIVQLTIFEWNSEIFDILHNFCTPTSSLDYTLFFIEVLTKLLDAVGQPTPTIVDAHRKHIFVQAVQLLTKFLPTFFHHCTTIISIISCDLNALHTQAPYLFHTFQTLPQQIGNLINKQTNTIENPQFRWYIKHALERTLPLSQHICERVNLDENATSVLFGILTQLLSLPETCEEISEHVLILLQRRTGVKLQHQPQTLLQISSTLIDLSTRILHRQTICNSTFTLFASSQSQKNLNTLASFIRQQRLLLKSLTSLHQLILAFSGPINGILSSKSDAMKRLQMSISMAAPTDPDVQGLREQYQTAENIVTGINKMKMGLLQLLCKSCLDLDCADIICQQALVCLLDCTSQRLYSTYITTPFLAELNLIEPLIKEIWTVILVNTDRERSARFEGKSRGGSTKADNENDDSSDQNDSTILSNSLALHDVLGTIRSSVQLLIKNVTSRQPHLILHAMGSTLHTSIKSLLEIATNEQAQIQSSNGKFETTISNNSKLIQYIFQTSSEFNQLLYPTFHFGMSRFFTAKAFLDLEAASNNAKTIFQQLQLLTSRVPTAPVNSLDSIDHEPVQLLPSTDYVDWSTLSNNHVNALLPLFSQIHELLLSSPSQCLGYLTHAVNIVAKLTHLYTTKPESLTKTILWLLSIASLNPNNMLSRTEYIGSTAHDGINYNSFFIDQATTYQYQSTQAPYQQTQYNPILTTTSLAFITNPLHTKFDNLASIAGTGQAGVNYGPLLDLRKHALHAILHLTKHLPQSFEASHVDFCTHVLGMINSRQSQNNTPSQPKSDTPAYVSIPTETVVLIEIMLCLGLYFNNHDIVQSVYTNLIFPHCQYVLESLDIAYFLADPYKFTTLLFGSHDEYKLIQSQLLQWDCINEKQVKLEQEKNNNTKNTVSLNNNNNDITLTNEREHVLPKPNPSQIFIPHCSPPTNDNQGQHTKQYYDNRTQSFRKQFLFALHTLQCVTKLLYSQSQSINSYIQSLHTSRSTSLNNTQSTNSATTILSFTPSHNTLPPPTADTIESTLNPTQLQQYQRIKQQSNTAQQMLLTIVQYLYSPVLRIMAMLLNCTSEQHISTLSNRLHSISLGSGFDHFLAVFSLDRYMKLQPVLSSQLPPNTDLHSSAITEYLWSSSIGPNTEQSDSFLPSIQPDPAQVVLSGHLDSTLLPIKSPQQISNQEIMINPTKPILMPADKSQSLIRHLWTWSDNLFEVLTQLINTFIQVAPEIIAADLYSIPTYLNSKHQQQSSINLYYTNPTDTFTFLTNETTTQHSTTVYVPQNVSPSSPAATAPVFQLPQSVVLSTNTKLSQFRPYLWLVVIGFLSNLPLRRQRLSLQRLLLPMLTAIPQIQLPQQHMPSLLQYYTDSTNATNQTASMQMISQVFNPSRFLFSSTIPMILSSLTSMITTNLHDLLLYSQYGAQSINTSVNTQTSPTLSLLADAFGNLPIPALRRLRGHTANLEHLRIMSTTSQAHHAQFCVSPHTHATLTPHNMIDTKVTNKLYTNLHSVQHVLSLYPFSQQFQESVFFHQTNQESLSSVPNLSQFILSPFQNNTNIGVNNPLNQTQTQFLQTIMSEVATTTNGQISQSTFLSLFPGELHQLQTLITSVIQRYDFSRHSASIQHQPQIQQQLMNQPISQSNLVPRTLSADPLHLFTDQLESSEVQHYITNAISIVQQFSSSSLNNERNLQNALSMLKQSQMFISLPLCSRLAEFASVTPSVCTMLTSLWDTVTLINYAKSAATITQHIISLLRYVGVPLCFASICTAQRHTQQLLTQQGQPPSQPFHLDAFNMGLYFRVLYYQSLKDTNQSLNNSKQPTQPTPQVQPSDPYQGLLIKKSSQDLMMALPTTPASSVFQNDEYWLHLCQVQDQISNGQLPQLNDINSNSSNIDVTNPTHTNPRGITDMFLTVTPHLLQWLRRLFTRSMCYLQRHFFAQTILSLTERQQLQQQPLGSPIFDESGLDNIVILIRDILTLFTQCQSYVTHDDLVKLVLSSIVDIKTNLRVEDLIAQVKATAQLYSVTASAMSIPSIGLGINHQTTTAATQNPYLNQEMASLLIQYARKTDVDEINHDRSGGTGNNSEANYFSYSDLISNKKGVMSEKNTSQPLSIIPTQTRSAKDQFKLFLFRIVLGSFLPLTSTV